METDKLISLKPHRNYKATLFSSVVLVLYIITYALMIKSNLRTGPIPTFNNIDPFFVLVIVLWVLIIISIIWAYRIAKKTGREPVLWVFLGIITGPIALLIISLKDYKVDNSELNEVVKKTRNEFKEELAQDRRNGLDTGHENRLEEKYDQLLNDRVADIITKNKVGILQGLVDNGIIDKNTDIKEKERLIRFMEHNKINDTEVEKWSPDWLDDENVCPACGAQLHKNSLNCLNCGLKIK